MIRIAGLLLLLSITSARADEPLRMGPDWFSRLKSPQTRIAALYEREKRVTKAKDLDDPDVFAADHHWTSVFPCPQPGKPEAQAVVTLRSWEASREISCGPEPDSYPPHPLEVQRRRGWDTELSASKPGLQLWKPGRPWLDGVLGFLVDSEGTQIGESFFASPAVIADIDGDGMLDLAGVSRYHLEEKNGKESYADCLEVSSLDGADTPKARFCCNFRNDMQLPRTWRFTVRPAASGTLEIVLVPTTGNAAEVVFHLTAEGLKEITSPLPAGILVDRKLPPGEWEGPRKFLKDHGLKFSGTGSDEARQIDASLPPPSLPLEMDAWNEYKWTLPDITGLPPRAAALVIARHNSHSLTLSHYDLEAIGDPVQPAKHGWLEKWSDPGWGAERVTVWWLRGDKAERWTEKDDGTFLVEKNDPQKIGRRIAIAHELDRIRLVPRSPLIPHDDGDGIFASDIDSYRIRAFSDAPESVKTTFGTCKPSIWRTIGARYDRELSAVLAYTLTANAPETGDSHPIKELAPVWLNPEEIKRTPPALCRAAIRAIGKNRWTDLEPLLLSLQASLGEPSAEEKALADLDQRREALWIDRRGGYPNDEKSEIANERDSRKVDRDMIELAARLAGNPGFEFRSAVEQALKELKELEEKE